MNTNLKFIRIISILFSVIIIAVVFLFYIEFYSNDKIVYVESAKILNDFKGAEIARKEFEKKSDKWKSNLDTLTQAVRNSMTEYEMKVRGMTSKDAETARQLINNKRGELATYQKSIQENVKQENTKLMGPVISRINSFLLKYGKSHGYKIILIANESGTIAYGKEGLDITEDVVKELNSTYPQK